MAGEDVVAAPVGRVGEESGDAAVEVALEVKPGGREPGWVVKGLEFSVVEGNVRVTIVGQGPVERR